MLSRDNRAWAFFLFFLGRADKNNRQGGRSGGDLGIEARSCRQSQQTDCGWAFVPPIAPNHRSNQRLSLCGFGDWLGGDGSWAELPHTSHRRIHPRSRRRLPRNPTSPRLFTPPTTNSPAWSEPGPRYLFPQTSPTPLHGRCPLPPTSTNSTLPLSNLSPSPRRAVGLWQPNHLPSRVQSCTSRGDNQPSIFSLLVRGIYSCLSPLADSDFLLLLATPHPPPPPLPSSPL